MTLDLCNYWDTVQAVILLNAVFYFIEYIQNNNISIFEKRSLSVFKWATRIFDFLSLVNDIADFSSIL